MKNNKSSMLKRAFASIAAGASLFTLCLLLEACQSFPEPKTEASALLIGKIEHQSVGTLQYRGFSVSGTNTQDITIYLEHLSSGKEYTVGSDLRGYFVSSRLPPGWYKLKRYSIKISNSDGWYNFGGNPSRYYKYFEILPGQVNNLGLIIWRSHWKTGQADVKGVLHEFDYEAEYLPIKQRYLSASPQSRWWSMPYSDAAIMDTRPSGR